MEGGREREGWLEREIERQGGRKGERERVTRSEKEVERELLREGSLSTSTQERERGGEKGWREGGRHIMSSFLPCNGIYAFIHWSRGD